MISDPDYINQKLLLLIQKIKQDQKDQGQERFSVDGKVMGFTDNVLEENSSQTTISSTPRPQLGRFDSGESDTGTSSETFQVCRILNNSLMLLHSKTSKPFDSLNF